MTEWYVYVGKYVDEIVYVGKGKNDRFMHLNSGTSHVYHANKFHFEGGIVDVEIIRYFSVESEALLYESFMITELKPAWNYNFKGVNFRELSAQRGKIRADNKINIRKSKFLGVSFNRYTRKKTGDVREFWRVKIRLNGKPVHIGNYATEVDAAIARDIYIIDNKLQGFVLNFPDKNYSEVLDGDLELE